MKAIKSEKEYLVILERVEQLLKVVDNNTSMKDSNFIELDQLSNLIADYEESHLES
ncbi:XRE family transcriptional regulator [Jiulongibacter sediminis]|jgi:HTH-type transcriptional regulator/antitoxin HigA|uniref:XRE family transcriptional regulator n=1 Tax=Jiulongibacter sediminis TaxID=1605367 RepID=UPI0026EF9E27|nr:XRE family transcriptional regulator [Jiulongibacter sediminis]